MVKRKVFVEEREGGWGHRHRNRHRETQKDRQRQIEEDIKT